jgi:hypothetical protein
VFTEDTKRTTSVMPLITTSESHPMIRPLPSTMSQTNPVVTLSLQESRQADNGQTFQGTVSGRLSLAPPFSKPAMPSSQARKKHIANTHSVLNILA